MMNASHHLVLVDAAVLVHSAVAICFAFHTETAEGPSRWVAEPVLHHVYAAHCYEEAYINAHTHGRILLAPVRKTADK
jgi:hypothetical protein